MHKDKEAQIEEVSRDLILSDSERVRSVGYTDEDIIVMDDLKKLSISRPVRMNMNVILICTQGRMQGELNGTTYTVEKQDILFCPPHVIMNNTMISPDFSCKILMLTNKIAQGFLRNNMGLWNEAFYVNRRYLIHLNEYQLDIFRYYYELIRKRIDEPNDFFQKEIMQAILQATMYEICGALYKAGQKQVTQTRKQGEVLFQRFMDLLSESKTKRHAITFYAKQLCVTPKYLSTVCKNISGKSASKWIQDYIDEDIRYYLRDTNLSIKEISNELAFPNISFFGKYVRSHFGMSAGEYRRQSKKP